MRKKIEKWAKRLAAGALLAGSAYGYYRRSQRKKADAQRRREDMATWNAYYGDDYDVDDLWRSRDYQGRLASTSFNG